MYRRGSEQVVSPDSSSCFSDEEWALLQQWQKDLYRTVMKKIHQALMSLGPLIATTVCSLSAKEKQDLCPKDRQNSSRRQSFHTSPSDPVISTGVLNKVRREDVGHLKNPKETARTGKNVCQRAESPIVVDDQCVTEEPGVIIIDPMETEEADSTNHQNPDANPQLATRGLQGFCIGKLHATVLCPNFDRGSRDTGFPVVTAVYSLSLNEEKKLFKEAPAGTFRAEPVVNSEQAEKTLLSKQNVRNAADTRRTDENRSQKQKPEPSRGSVQQRGVKCKRRPKKIGNSSKASEKTQPTKLVLRKSNTNEKQSSPMETNSTGQDWSLGGEKSVQYGTKANKLANFILSLGTPKIGISDTYGDCESNRSSSLVSNVPPNTQQEQATHSSMKCDDGDSITAECSGRSETRSRERTYACTECDKCFSTNSYLIEHCKMHASEKTHKCVECSKCFFTKTQLVRHSGVHSVPKKYQCTFCPKSFDQKHNIDGHLRTHTGEKPYKCLECGKEFTWRSGFVMHQRRHDALRKAKTTT